VEDTFRCSLTEEIPVGGSGSVSNRVKLRVENPTGRNRKERTDATVDVRGPHAAHYVKSTDGLGLLQIVFEGFGQTISHLHCKKHCENEWSLRPEGPPVSDLFEVGRFPELRWTVRCLRCNRLYTNLS
jgi:hypothetical protein